jgi:hypothetical protein
LRHELLEPPGCRPQGATKKELARTASLPHDAKLGKGIRR